MPAFTTSQLAAALGAWARVDKPTTVIPQGEATPYFTVSGSVLVHQVLGKVTVAFTDTDEATNNCKLIANPTTGADTDLCAVANLEEVALGTRLTITGDKADPLVFSLDGASPSQEYSVLVHEGTIDFSTEFAETIATGETSWTILYTPVDVNATITAIIPGP